MEMVQSDSRGHSDPGSSGVHMDSGEAMDRFQRLWGETDRTCDGIRTRGGGEGPI